MPKNPRKMGKMMAFDTRGSVQTMPPFTCSKKRNAPKEVRFIMRI